jgi:hypothetical protein
VSAGGQLLARAGGRSPLLPRELVAGALIGGMVFVSAALFAVTGNALLGLLPVIGVTAAYIFWLMPLRYWLYGFVTIASTSDIMLMQSGGGGTWIPPLYVFWYLLFENLNKATGIGALRFSAIEVLYLVMVGVAAARTFLGRRVDSAGRIPGPSALYGALAVAFVAVIWLELLGVARGGDVRQSLWQLRQLFWLPVLTGLFSYALRGPGDARVFAWIATIAACIKLAIGSYYLTRVAWPAGLEPETMTTHGDSVLFVTVLVMWLVVWLHAPSRGRFAALALVTAVMMTALVLNNRRIAWVALLASLMTIVLILRGPVKRLIMRTVVMCIPLFVLYLGAGRYKKTGVFKPAAMVMSVFEQKDASSQTRDIENYNLIQTLKPNKLLGTGWGHEYRELVVAYNISHAFEQYRFVAHNSILWLFSIAGMFGFTMLWLPVATGVFLARRSYLLARTPQERTIAAVAISVYISYVIQAWGDMGTQGQLTTTMLAVTLALTGKLAIATGAWPQRLRLFTFRTAQPPRPTAVRR